MEQSTLPKKLDSKAEEIIYSYLPQMINSEHYTIETHCSLFTVLNYEQKELIGKFRQFCLSFFDDDDLQENNFLKNDISKTHFDFVIFTKDFHMPILFIEVNGSTHLTMRGKVMMDSFKLALCQSNSIPLVVIPLYKSYTEDEIHEMLQSTLSEINIRKVLPAYCPECGKRLKMLTNKQSKANFYICEKCKTRDKTYNLDDIPLILNQALPLSGEIACQSYAKDYIDATENYNPIEYPEKFIPVPFMSYSDKAGSAKDKIYELSAEQKIYKALLSILDDKYYALIPHVHLRDIFSYQNNADDTNIYKFLAYHVDFVIFDTKYYPVLAIEVHGTKHKTDKKMQWTDTQKEKLFSYHHIPLVVSDWSVSRDDETIVQDMKNEILKSSRAIHCWNCHTIQIIEHNYSERVIKCPKCERTVPVLSLFKS